MSSDDTVIQAMLVGMGLREVPRLIYKINYALIIGWNRKRYRE